MMRPAHILSIILIYLASKTIAQSQVIGPQQTLNISLEYQTSGTDIVPVYTNNQLSSNFLIDQNYFNCANYNLFVLNLTQANQKYSWVVANISQNLIVGVFMGYQNPIINNITCTAPGCTIPFDENCPPSTYSTNFYKGIIYTTTGQQITQFKYYTQCNINNIQNFIQIQWGLVIIAVVNVITIWVCSKFQQLHSYNNFTISANYIMVAIYIALLLLKFFLFHFNVPNVILAISYICTICSFFFGIISVCICFCELAYCTKIDFLQWGYEIKKVRIRVMDVIGVLLGVVFLCAWYFTRNVIISDIIFMMIYLSIIKILKFGSLKIAVIVFAFNFVILIGFYKINSTIDSSYTDGNYTYFNNPLFLIIPNLVNIPNRRCAWYFIISMSFAGMLLSYLERFDRNRSSIIYALTFIITYIIGTILWFIITIFISFPLPYELFSIPIALLLLVFFANRRGELNMLFNGKFYDQQRMSFSFMEQMKQQLQGHNDKDLNHSIFQQLKYEPKDSASNDISFKKSNDISGRDISVKKSAPPTGPKKQLELKHMNSQDMSDSRFSHSQQDEGADRKHKSQLVMNIRYH